MTVDYDDLDDGPPFQRLPGGWLLIRGLDGRRVATRSVQAVADMDVDRGESVVRVAGRDIVVGMTLHQITDVLIGNGQ